MPRHFPSALGRYYQANAEEGQPVESNGQMKYDPQAMEPNAMKARKRTVVLSSCLHESIAGPQRPPIYQISGQGSGLVEVVRSSFVVLGHSHRPIDSRQRNKQA